MMIKMFTPKKGPAKKAPTKKSPTAKSPRAKSTKARKPRAAAKKRAPSKGGKTNRGWLKMLWGFAWKAGLAVAAILLFVGIYLDTVVKQRFEGQLFDLPTVVYARVLDLSPGTPISIQQVRNELDVLNYRKVSAPRHPGEYSSSSTKIELIRRPFEFVDGPEADRHVMLHFDSNELTRIQSLEKKGDMGYLRIEPKMLGMLEKSNDEQRLFLKRNQWFCLSYLKLMKSKYTKIYYARIIN